ncbi:hypothetical protein Dda_1081 [Drechslerella dactyloides]|uniref:CFEM domain-containing protein n=1 Tax=Drechslerella dactyloides TaxID=74499 RepID=A0AAD6J5G3_DREDA|nr:hypothetical protein Dda_1081 [Drechslerella dactyloides]
MILRRVFVLGHLLFVPLFPTATAQVTVAVPLCAVNCLADALLQSSCPQTDTRCLCQSTRYVSAAIDCIREACNALDIRQAEQYATENCRASGVVLSIPGSSSTTAGASSTTFATRTTASTTSTSADSNTTGGTAARETGSGSTTSGAAANGSGSSTNMGPIIGGAVGGVAALALIILGVMLVMRERRKKMAMAASSSSEPPSNSQSIWTGGNTYSWDPHRDVRDVQGGVADR